MIAVNDLIARFRIPLDEGWGYIWGAYGQTWTQAKQDAATRAQTIKYGQQWVGKRVIDCSGMFYWSYKQLGHAIYHGSDTIWRKYCSEKGKLKDGAREDGCPIKWGTAVFLYRKSDNCRHHIGLYVGDDTVIEAKGTKSGVVTSRLDHWDEWGELKDIDYSGAKEDQPMPILRKGSSGPAVTALQELLNAWYHEYKGTAADLLEADGIFGNKTLSAVATFQEASGLTVDGIAGPQTQAVLAAYTARPQEHETEPADEVPPTGPAAPELPEDDDEYETPTTISSATYADLQHIENELAQLLAYVRRLKQ